MKEEAWRFCRDIMESLLFCGQTFYSTLIEGRIQENELSKYLRIIRSRLQAAIILLSGDPYIFRQVPEGMDPLLLDICESRRRAERKVARRNRFSYLGNTVMIVQFEEGSGRWQT